MRSAVIFAARTRLARPARRDAPDASGERTRRRGDGRARRADPTTRRAGPPRAAGYEPRFARRLRLTLSARLRVACARFVFDRFETFRFERFPRFAAIRVLLG
jgi:hypothetical protein